MSVNSNVICSVRTDTEVMCIRSIWEPHQEMVRPAPNGDERYFTDGAGTHHIGLNVGFSANPLRERSSVMDSTLSAVTRPYGLKVGFVYETTFIKGFGMQLGLNYTFGSSQGKWTDTPNSTIKKTAPPVMLFTKESPDELKPKLK